MTTEEKLEDTTLTPKILDILSYQHAITSQGENYTGEKDWALNKLKSLIAESINQARAEERERVGKIIEESHWECPEHGLPNYEKTDCVECNSALEINVVLNALLSSLANPKDKE